MLKNDDYIYIKIPKLKPNFILLSVILHVLLLLFLLSISTVFTLSSKENKKKAPELYIPSYVYHGSIPKTISQQQTQNIQNQPKVASPKDIKALTAVQNNMNKHSIFSSTKKNVARQKKLLQQSSILAMSRQIIHTNQIDNAISRLNQKEPPILLVGDKSAPVDPLIKLMGRSLSANFRYPHIEGSFGVHGRVYVELVLHPEGYFSDVRVLQSSDNQDFDSAALYAVNQAPTVVGADKFLTKPTRFVVGFIFD